MKLSDIKGEKALDVLAELMTPIESMAKDSELIKNMSNKEYGGFKIVQYLLKNHKKETIEVMAILNDTPVEEFDFNLLTLPSMLIEIITDPILVELFTSLGRKEGVDAFGSATESIEA